MSSMTSHTKLANTFGAKSARACDNCMKKRARWYSAVDDAFLCQSCYSSIHSANYSARRNERVRLKISSIKSLDAKFQIYEPFWQKRFTKKARTPRQKKHAKSISPPHLVPDICSEDYSNEENEEQLLCRVPTFDQSVSKLCNFSESAGNIHAETTQTAEFGHESKYISDYSIPEMNNIHGFLPSEMDLAEFAADVESLLGKGVDDNLISMEGLGLQDFDEKEMYQFKECDSLGCKRVKVEVGKEDFESNFDYGSAITGKAEDKTIAVIGEPILMNMNCDSRKNENFLRLDYEGIIKNWDGEKSPWTTGERPELDSGDSWPDCMGKCGTMHACRDMSGAGAAAMGDGGREAMVSRYREKRRNRLFSKKIRYEVRKLNAEKRPRMKGRFIKRANFVTAAPNISLIR